MPVIYAWLEKVWKGVVFISENHPFLFYGFDWLAFAYLVIALLFIGPSRNSVKNKWLFNGRIWNNRNYTFGYLP
ncbi:MAG: hypothetical protein H7122_17490 [Chitinophagaceae bacterium]|nr:hypothetical protein [Chitinophagaceae bacterium]